MTRQERLLRLARLRGDRAAELILTRRQYPKNAGRPTAWSVGTDWAEAWTEAELRAAWGDR